MIYSVDREGWGYVHDDLLDAENYLEWNDIRTGEYQIIDDAGRLFTCYEAEEGYYGYKLRETANTNQRLLEAIRTALADNSDATGFRIEGYVGS